jgi:GWxTD domain-containing protein
MKGTWQVIPVVRRIYGEALSTLMAYVEVYNRTPGTSLTLKYQVYDRWDATVLRHSEAVQEDSTAHLSSRILPRRVWLELSALPEGAYRLEIAAREEPSGGQAHTSGGFQIWRSYRTLFKNHPEDVLEQLQYIASREELQPLRSEDQGERMKAWDGLWERWAPVAQSKALQEEYYQRVKSANAEFTNGVHPGWKTDQGRIYILYGPPDEIQRHPFEAARKPYEIWQYYEINQEFVFVDEDGFGEYRLQDQAFGRPSRQIEW